MHLVVETGSSFGLGVLSGKVWGLAYSYRQGWPQGRFVSGTRLVQY